MVRTTTQTNPNKENEFRFSFKVNIFHIGKDHLYNNKKSKENPQKTKRTVNIMKHIIELAWATEKIRGLKHMKHIFYNHR